MSYEIRRYRLSDIPAILKTIEQFLTEEREAEYSNYFKHIDFSQEKVYKELSARTTDMHFFCDVVVDEKDGIVGGLSADLVEYYFSHQKLACDRIFYIKSGYNNRVALSQLLENYYTWAKEQGAVEVQLSNSTGFRQKAFGIFACRNKFKQFSVGFSRRIT